MTVEHNIQQIDEKGIVETVLTDYKVHTISLVGKGALGRNLTKLKSKDQIKTEEGKAIMAKIEKAKALDAEVTKEESVEQISEESTEADKSKSVEEGVSVGEENLALDSEEEVSQGVETLEQSPDGEEEKVASEASTPEEVVEPDNKGEEVDKQKMYSMDEYLQASKTALDGVANLVKEIREKAPEADHWEVFEIAYSAIYRIDDADWEIGNSLWEKVWEEVYTEVTNRVTKAKSLKVSKTGTMDEKLKALEAIDPELAKVFITEYESNKAKTLKAEEEREAVIRAKALEEGAEKYKRISSEDCTTDQITDAMIELETTSQGLHTVISKALDNASLITSAGELFRDIGSTDTVNTMSPDEFVEAKSKSLASEKDKIGESYNMAALRATIRQSDEYVANYS